GADRVRRAAGPSRAAAGDRRAAQGAGAAVVLRRRRLPGDRRRRGTDGVRGPAGGRGDGGRRRADVPGAARAPPRGGRRRMSLVEVSGVTFGYRAAPVLRDVSFAIGAGELVALCGPNGAGKSTLLRLLLGLHAPSAGQVTLAGAPLSTLSRRQIARRAALLPQDAPADVPLSVREAVALGRLPHLGRLQPETAADVAAVARALEATDTMALAERRCDRILLLAGGVLAADATPAQVLTADTLARVFGVRADVRIDAGG